MEAAHPKQIICLLLQISAGAQHPRWCQWLLTEGPRTGTELPCPAQPVPCCRAGAPGQDPAWGLGAGQCGQGTGEAGAQLCKEPCGKGCQWAGGLCGTAEPESPWLPPPLLRLAAGAIPAEEVCLAGGEERRGQVLTTSGADKVLRQGKGGHAARVSSACPLQSAKRNLSQELFQRG